ncbi:MAG: gamma-butyrobetaine hydroxylase-like domain-containing protein [Sandaracinaceae bacterium]
MSDAPEPVELRAPVGARRLEIDWADGTTDGYRHVILRGFCPCAHCQGHHGPVRWVEGAPAADLTLDAIEPVGNYALTLRWGDGHATGIYTFRFLKALAEVGELHEDAVTGRVFTR